VLLHFFLYTSPGELVTAVVMSAALAFVVWWIVKVVVTLVACAVWLVYSALRDRLRPGREGLLGR
jgi:hypothetical protein